MLEGRIEPIKPIKLIQQYEGSEIWPTAITSHTLSQFALKLSKNVFVHMINKVAQYLNSSNSLAHICIFARSGFLRTEIAVLI